MNDLILNIYGRDIPSSASIEHIISQIPNDKSQKIFVDCAHKWRICQEKKCFPELFIVLGCNVLERKQLTLFLKINTINALLANVAGNLDFNLFMQSQAIEDWHETFMFNFSGGDGNKLRDEARLYSQVIRGKKIYKPTKKTVVGDYSYLFKANKAAIDRNIDVINEYHDALNYIRFFSETIGFISRGNDEARLFLYELVELRKQLIENDKSNEEYFYICPFCGDFDVVQQGKTPRCCELCEKNYQRSRKNINRPPLTHKEWIVAFGGKRRTCIDCGERRQVNINVKCRICFSQSFAQ